MLPAWIVFASIIGYLCLLFGAAHYGDTAGRSLVRERARGLVYALSIAVYCTSWTFFGSIGVATSAGLDFLLIYIGPCIAFVFGQPLIRRVISIAKLQNITSVSDMISARYGKSSALAALVTGVVAVGVIPYLALQLKAISISLETVLQSSAIGHAAVAHGPAHGFGAGLQFLVAMVLAGFAIAFGTRRVDTTEHQDGLMLAIALESVVKLTAFLVVAGGIVFGAKGGEPVRGTAMTLGGLIGRTSDLGTLLTMMLLSMSAIILLPRQFHVTVVENRDVGDVRYAGRLFPLYLVAINVLVLPVALAGLAAFPEGSIDRDMTLLALPIARGDGAGTVVALLGGLSAATAMVIVASVALSIMISNTLVLPFLLHRRTGVSADPTDLPRLILLIRRIAIVAIITIGYGYYQTARSTGLAAIGLLSFAAVAQVLPAFAAGFFWRRGTSRGAIAGIGVGTALWAYTLFLPSFANPPAWLATMIAHGPFGCSWLRPMELFGVRLPPLTHGTLWSVGANTLAFLAVSLTRYPTAGERLQASIFVENREVAVASFARLGRTRVTEGQLQATVARYLGDEQTRGAFDSFTAMHGRSLQSDREADALLLEFAERLLTAVVGAASSRLVLALLVRQDKMSSRAAIQLLDDAASAIHYNRDLLQHAIDHARQAIAVLDRDLRLICWNRAFRDIFDLPPDLLRVGRSADAIIAFNAARGFYGPGSTDQIVDARLRRLTSDAEPSRLRIHPSQRVIEVWSVRIPDDVTVTTYTDITDSVAAEETLAAANEELELRVRQRTDELVRLNGELAQAKAAADEANASKTRFLAAASHDILQPLNAARLYATALVEHIERSGAGTTSDEQRLSRNIDASLEAVEEILTALLDISRLDASATVPERSVFRIDDLLCQLQVEFAPLAAERALDLRFVTCSATVRSDRRLLRRLIQNLISNAIKYTSRGTVLVGCRRRGNGLAVQVWDTGLGIAPDQQNIVFHEFQRLEDGARVARGLGLGLSIVQRLARVLDHDIVLSSRLGHGSMFEVQIPVAREVPAAADERPSGQPRIPLPFDGLDVLVIDNEQRILDGMNALLGGWGCTPVCATSLEQALAVLKVTGATPAVVVADYHLDQGDGIEAIEKIRERFGAAVNAVLLTADRSFEVTGRAAAAEIAFLPKPLKPAALRALFSRWRSLRRDSA